MDMYITAQYVLMSILVTALALVVLLGGLVGVIYLTRRMAQAPRALVPNSDPLDIARQRYAKGEISREEYEQITKDLSG